MLNTEEIKARRANNGARQSESGTKLTRPDSVNTDPAYDEREFQGAKQADEHRGKDSGCCLHHVP